MRIHDIGSNTNTVAAKLKSLIQEDAFDLEYRRAADRIWGHVSSVKNKSLLSLYCMGFLVYNKLK
jgi:hypothetical protein